MKQQRIIVAVLASLLLFSSSSAFAAKSGSKSESASAAWLVNGSAYSCNSGTSPSNLTDSKVDNNNAYVWIKSSSNVVEENITWTSYDKGGQLDNGDLDYVASCGQFRLMAFDVNEDEDLTVSNNLTGFGSVTFKFRYDSKNFTSDTATLY